MLFLFLPLNTVEAFSVAPHEVNSDTVWKKENGPYIVPWSFSIDSGSVLCIESGTVVALQNVSIEVRGTLQVGLCGLATSSPERIVFESILSSGLESSDVTEPSEEGNLSLLVYGGRVYASNFDVQSDLFVYGEGAYVNIKNATSSTGQFILEQGSVFDGKNISIQKHNVTIIDTHSSFVIDNSFISGGYINTVGQSTFTVSSTTLSDMVEVRVFDQSNLSFTDVTYKDGGGFLFQNKSNGLFKGGAYENITADTAFSVFDESNISFDHSFVSPLFSDFILLTDGSTLCATSTHITNIFEKGIQAIREVKVSLYDVIMDHVLSLRPRDTFFVELVGSTIHAIKSYFTDVAGNAFELYASNSNPFSVIDITDSRISEYGKSGLYAVSAIGTVTHSVLEGGRKGLEHISSHISIADSTIRNNSEYGAIAYVPTYQLSAINNFWGDASGPYHDTKNKDGVGNVVSENILFNPWLTDEPTKPCCSSVLFLPGLMASRLYKHKEGGDIRLWEPGIGADLIPQLFLNSQGKSLGNGIYAKDIIDEALVSRAGPNVYKSFIADMDQLKMGNIIADWQAIPYDWRLSLDDILHNGSRVGDAISYLEATTSPYIISEIKRLADESKTKKVTIIAHSNGGLVTKALMLTLRELGIENIVDLLIFVAVPQIGTPQALGALLHGFGQGIPDTLPFLALPEIMRAFGKNMPGAYGLIPSTEYFKTVTDPVLVFDKSMNTTRYTVTSSTTLFNFLNGNDGRIQTSLQDLSSPAILENYFLSYAEDMHRAIDAWRPPEEMRVIQIAGWGNDTVKGIHYYKGPKRGQYTTYFRPLFTSDGDKTVIVPSALALATSTPNIQRYWLNLNQRHGPAKRSHADILEIKDLRDFIKNIITGKNSELPITFSTSSPVADATKRLQFFLHGDTAVMNVYDDKGNHTGISTTTEKVEENIPGSTYGVFGNVVYISLSENTSSNTLFLHGNSNRSTQQNTFTLDVSEVINNDILVETSFMDIPTSSSTVSILSVPDSFAKLKPLEVDINNDGVNDLKVNPGESAGGMDDVKDVITTEPKKGSKHRSSVPTSAIGTSVTQTPLPKIEVRDVSPHTRTAVVFNAVTNNDLMHVYVILKEWCINTVHTALSFLHSILHLKWNSN